MGTSDEPRHPLTPAEREMWDSPHRSLTFRGNLMRQKDKEMTEQKIKAGDVVHVRMTVVEVRGPGDLLVEARGNDALNYRRCGVAPDEIVHVEPRALQVGDKVKRPKYHADDAEIKAIDGDKAWLSFPDGSHSTLLLANLERV